MTSTELPMGVSLAVAGIRTAVSATRQSQIDAGAASVLWIEDKRRCELREMMSTFYFV